MQDDNKVDEVSLECAVCLAEIPSSVAESAEADEYVSHFCGLDCYQQWREQPEQRTED